MAKMNRMLKNRVHDLKIAFKFVNIHLLIIIIYHLIVSHFNYLKVYIHLIRDLCCDYSLKVYLIETFVLHSFCLLRAALMFKGTRG